jgi:hypothetical protein
LIALGSFNGRVSRLSTKVRSERRIKVNYLKMERGGSHAAIISCKELLRVLEVESPSGRKRSLHIPVPIGYH